MKKPLLIYVILLSLGPHAATALPTTESSANAVLYLQEQQARPTVFIASIFGGYTMANLGGTPQNRSTQVIDSGKISPQVDIHYEAATASQKNPSASIFFGVESRLTPTIALQYGIGYDAPATFLAEGKSTETIAPDSVNKADATIVKEYAYQYRVQNRQLLAEGKLFGTVAANFHPYALVGVGTSTTKTSDYAQTLTSTSPDATRNANKQQTSFADSSAKQAFVYKLGVGVEYDVTAHWRMGVGYSLTDIGEVKLGDQSVPDPTNPSFPPQKKSGSGLGQDKLYIYELAAQLSYVF